jgi:hypothetical protein
MRKVIVDEFVSLDGVAHWPNAPDEERVIAEPLACQSSTVVEGDVGAAVAALWPS